MRKEEESRKERDNLQKLKAKLSKKSRGESKKRCRPKATAPSMTKKTEVVPVNCLLHLKQSQQHHHLNLAFREKQTIVNLIATALTRTSIAGLMKMMWWKTPALTGYTVHTRDGCIKKCIDYDMGNDANGNDLLYPFCCI